MEDSNNVHHPRVAVLCWDLSFTPIQVYQSVGALRPETEDDVLDFRTLPPRAPYFKAKPVLKR